MVAIQSGKKPPKSMKVCSKHFKNEDYTESTTPGFYILKNAAVPSQDLPARSHDSVRVENVDRAKRAARRTKALTSATSSSAATDASEPLTFLYESSSGSECLLEVETLKSHTEDVEFVAASEAILQISGTQEQSQGTDQGTQTLVETVFLSIGEITEEQLKYFTGLTRERFRALFCFCMRDNPTVPFCKLPKEDQLLLVLSKYKLNLDYILISTMFKVDRRLASNLLTFWTDILYYNFKLVDWWNLRLQGENLYSAVIDCTEIPTVQSSNLEHYQQMFSNYKNRATLKGLVAIDEAGIVIYCSALYGGSTSDKQMVNLSGFIDKLKKGDIVFADRGFDISDLLESKGVALNIPPFKRNRGQLTEEEVMLTRFIAQRRIHVERIIGLGKVHQILVDVLPSHLWPNASKIFFNCMMLCNFKNGIVTRW